MNNSIFFSIAFLVFACSSSGDKTNNKNAAAENNSSVDDFKGKLTLVVDGETSEFEAERQSNARLSFQDKGIAIILETPNGEKKIASIVILSPDIYENKSHRYSSGIPAQEGVKRLDESKNVMDRMNSQFSIKFKRLDKMDEDEYISLDRGIIDFEYDDEEGNFTMTFEGVDSKSTSDRGEVKTPLSGKLVLQNAYLMDSRD